MRRRWPGLSGQSPPLRDPCSARTPGCHPVGKPRAVAPRSAGVGVPGRKPCASSGAWWCASATASAWGRPWRLQRLAGGGRATRWPEARAGSRRASPTGGQARDRGAGVVPGPASVEVLATQRDRAPAQSSPAWAVAAGRVQRASASRAPSSGSRIPPATYGRVAGSSTSPGCEISSASTSNTGAAGSRHRMQGPSRPAVKRIRSAYPSPVVRRDVERHGTYRRLEPGSASLPSPDEPRATLQLQAPCLP